MLGFFVCDFFFLARDRKRKNYECSFQISNSNGWAVAAARVCRTLVGADGNSLNKQWFLFELTLYNRHSPATWRRWHRDNKPRSGKAWPPNTPGAQESEGDVQLLTSTQENYTQGYSLHNIPTSICPCWLDVMYWPWSYVFSLWDTTSRWEDAQKARILI